MRQTLALQPIHSSSGDILRCFSLGLPLSSEQLNFLEWHEHELSNPKLDPVLRYYLEALKKRKQQYRASFLLPHERLNAESIEQLKKRLISILQTKEHSHVYLDMTQQQFTDFKDYTAKDLIFWHGNQFLTGTPFYPSAIPPVIYFQWGNFFGIVKFVILAGEKGLKGNLLVAIEDREERDLDACVEAYQHQLQDAIQHQQAHLITHSAGNPPQNEKNEKRLHDYYLIHPGPV